MGRLPACRKLFAGADEAEEALVSGPTACIHLYTLLPAQAQPQAEKAIPALCRWGLVARLPGGRLLAQPLPAALVALDAVWDSIYDFPAAKEASGKADAGRSGGGQTASSGGELPGLVQQLAGSPASGQPEGRAGAAAERQQACGSHADQPGMAAGAEGAAAEGLLQSGASDSSVVPEDASGQEVEAAGESSWAGEEDQDQEEQEQQEPASAFVEAAEAAPASRPADGGAIEQPVSCAAQEALDWLGGGFAEAAGGLVDPEPSSGPSSEEAAAALGGMEEEHGAAATTAAGEQAPGEGEPAAAEAEQRPPPWRVGAVPTGLPMDAAGLAGAADEAELEAEGSWLSLTCGSSSSSLELASLCVPSPPARGGPEVAGKAAAPSSPSRLLGSTSCSSDSPYRRSPSARMSLQQLRRLHQQRSAAGARTCLPASLPVAAVGSAAGAAKPARPRSSPGGARAPDSGGKGSAAGRPAGSRAARRHM